MRRIHWALLGVALLVAGCSGGGGGTPDVAAVVEGVEIPSKETESLVDAFLNRQKQEGAKADLTRDRLAKLVLGYQIKVTFLESLADKMGVDTKPQSYFDAAAGAVSEESFQAIGLRPQDFARTLRAGQLSEAIAEKRYPNVTVSENALREEYDRRAGQLGRNWKANVQVALFDSQEPAGKVAGEVAGGKDFKSAATGLGAARVESVEVNGLTAQLPGEVLDAIGALQPGEVSGAIGTGSGWIAVIADSRDELEQLTFEDLRPELNDILVQLERAKLFQEWFDKQFEKADVEVDGHYGKWNADVTAVI